MIGSKEDPGDSLHRVCMYALGELWFKGMRPSLPMAYCIEGSWVRYPGPGWWSDKDRLSRDQATPLIILMGYTSKKLLFIFLLKHILRLGFFTNTRRNGATRLNHGTDKYAGHPEDGQYDYSWKLPDFITLEFIAIYIRACGFWFLYPILCILDLETLLSSILWKYRKGTDVLNHLIASTYFINKYPTPTSLLAYRLIDRVAFNEKMSYYFNRIGLMEMYRLWRFK